MTFAEQKAVIQEYIRALQAIDARQANEHTYRTPLENLFNSLQLKGKQTTAVQEAKSEQVDGTPDFFVYEDYNQLFRSLIGFIECKKITRNISEIIPSAQIAKYAKTTENIIITNYRDFILLQNGKQQASVQLLGADLSASANPNKEQDFINLLQDFYNYDYAYIKTKKHLVSALSAQAFYYSVTLREYVQNPGNNEQTFFYKFDKLFQDFQQSLNYEYTLADFCDIYAQSFVYGLFLARMEMFEHNQANDKFREDNLDWLNNIPLEYKLLYEFLSTGYEPRYLPTPVRVALVNIAKNINLIDIGSVSQEFIKQYHGNTSITAYLYEDFLKEYDTLKGTENRKESGVYYTPKEVTRFIAKSVQEIIKNQFGQQAGFLAPEVKVLDFACGTGTFIDSVYELMLNPHASPLEKQKIKEKILKDIYGFELLFTPYIVAHTVLTKFLKDNGVNIASGDRLPVYLTNTLDLAPHAISQLLPNLKQEHEKALQVKQETDILAIIGNPPYFNGKSKSASKEIDEFTQDYKKDLNEKKINLDDLYIKFIRFAEWKINKSGSGVAGLITNNSFLDGVTHRQMRKHLLETFDEIYILNLHGNTRKKEQDKNIFDIMVGVCITLFVKYPAGQRPKGNTAVYYYSTLINGLTTRPEKLHLLDTHTLTDLPWKRLNPFQTPFYWFTDKDLSLQNEYDKFWKITDIFGEYNSGIQSKNDLICALYTNEKRKTIKDNFLNLSIEELIKKYDLKNGRDWQVAWAKEDLHKSPILATQINYRPFDIRYTNYTGKTKGIIAYPRYKTTQHFIGKENLGLCFTRNIDSNCFADILITNKMVDLHYISGQTYIAPLYLYQQELGQEVKTPNFTTRFQKEYLAQNAHTPEDTLNYIYAVLHCPVYRKKYLEFLKTDFPSVPMTSDLAVFSAYARLGRRLIRLHTLEDIPQDPAIREEYEGEIVNFALAKIIPPTTAQPKLTLETTSGKKIIFNGVTPEIYAFQIGSYAPVDKWLKYRKKDGVLLGVDDLLHLKNMIIALKHTMETMEEIEALGATYLKDL